MPLVGAQVLAVAVICLSLGFWEKYKEKQNTAAIDQKKGKGQKKKVVSFTVCTSPAYTKHCTIPGHGRETLS